MQVTFAAKTYIFLSAVAAASASIAILSFAAGLYRDAWAMSVVIILCMECRVIVGGRLARTSLFWIHLSAAIPFIACLTVLLLHQWHLLVATTAILGSIVLVTGALLWTLGLHAITRVEVL